jgi:hypothetical protein
VILMPSAGQGREGYADVAAGQAVFAGVCVQPVCSLSLAAFVVFFIVLFAVVTLGSGLNPILRASVLARGLRWIVLYPGLLAGLLSLDFLGRIMLPAPRFFHDSGARLNLFPFNRPGIFVAEFFGFLNTFLPLCA